MNMHIVYPRARHPCCHSNGYNEGWTKCSTTRLLQTANTTHINKIIKVYILYVCNNKMITYYVQAHNIKVAGIYIHETVAWPEKYYNFNLCTN